MVNITKAGHRSPNAIKEFYHLILLYLNYHILPDIFMREFRKDMHTEIIINQYCHAFKSSDNKTHPDSKLAVAIRECCTKIEDNDDSIIYIGVSHLYCVFCSVFLSTHMIDFRGRSGQFEKWKIPDKIKEIDSPSGVIELKESILIIFNNSIQIQRKGISEASPDKLFDFQYDLSKIDDYCQRASGFISNDTIKYIEYYSDLPDDALKINVDSKELSNNVIV